MGPTAKVAVHIERAFAHKRDDVPPAEVVDLVLQTKLTHAGKQDLAAYFARALAEPARRASQRRQDQRRERSSNAQSGSGASWPRKLTKRQLRRSLWLSASASASASAAARDFS